MALESDISTRLPWWNATDKPNWDAVYSEQLPRVYNYFCYRFGNTAVAEDLTSRTFEKAWSARQRYRRDLAGFATWLFSIARNVAVDHLRSNRQHAPLEAAANVATDERSPEEQHLHESELAHLAQLIAQLTAREQDVLALKYGAENTNRAIARLTGLSESNIGTILHRAVKTLREQW